MLIEIFRGQIFECLWHKCDWQFEDATDCVDHIIGEGSGHVQTHFIGLQGEEAVFNCLWRNCIRLKKSAPSFPHLVRLLKHVREVHLNKCARIVMPADRSKYVFGSLFSALCILFTNQLNAF